MLRSLLVLLLLANYLLVVGAGLGAGRPEPPRYSAQNPYKHSKHCQQQNYLQLDCFEHCNGDQPAVEKKLPSGAGLYFLVQLKGLDLHCPVEVLPLQPQPGRRPEAVVVAIAAQAAAVAGFGMQHYPPPRQG
jgi:hypothetical protein